MIWTNHRVAAISQHAQEKFQHIVLSSQFCGSKSAAATKMGAANVLGLSLPSIERASVAKHPKHHRPTWTHGAPHWKSAANPWSRLENWRPKHINRKAIWGSPRSY